jgi:hypothetical protein
MVRGRLGELFALAAVANIELISAERPMPACLQLPH